MSVIGQPGKYPTTCCFQGTRLASTMHPTCPQTSLRQRCSEPFKELAKRRVTSGSALAVKYVTSQATSTVRGRYPMRPSRAASPSVQPGTARTSATCSTQTPYMNVCSVTRVLLDDCPLTSWSGEQGACSFLCGLHRRSAFQTYCDYTSVEEAFPVPFFYTHLSEESSMHSHSLIAVRAWAR